MKKKYLLKETKFNVLPPSNGVYSPFYLKTLFRQYNIKPRKSLGQNFVINKSVIDRMVEVADLKQNDTALEIGPGIGTLTVELAKKVKKVIAIEKDAALCNILHDTIQKENLKNVTIINKDVLKIQITKSPVPSYGKDGADKLQINSTPPFPGKRAEQNSNSKTYKLADLQTYKLIANIPYYITQPIIRLFLESENPPQEITLLMQKEVAQRICARLNFSKKNLGGQARRPKMNLLAISVQFYAKPEIITYISRNNFWPKPKVDSAIIRITPTDTNQKRIKAEKFFKVARAGFSAPRKMLINNLADKFKISKEKLTGVLNEAGIDRQKRAENLTIADWQTLTQIIKIET